MKKQQGGTEKSRRDTAERHTGYGDTTVTERRQSQRRDSHGDNRGKRHHRPWWIYVETTVSNVG